jgi:short-subunit dehydrogenase
MKTAIVTGSSYGIGRSTTSKLLDEGYKVYGISRSETKIDNENFVWLKCDLYNQNEIDKTSKLINENKIDLLM